jgi:hypothetical protein
MRATLVVVATWIVASVALGQSEEHHHDLPPMNAPDAAPSAAIAPSVDSSSAAPLASASSAPPPIRLTINPEARVSVAMAGAVPSPVACGSALEIPVEVVNQGFVTAPLEVALVNAPAGVAVHLDPTPLKGVPAESRMLRVTLTQPGLTDLTVAFRARNEIADLGGRDRVHFLVECRQRGD